MEQALERNENITHSIWKTLFLAGFVCATVIIVFGMDSIAPGAHDTFHDFRHAIGMSCH